MEHSKHDHKNVLSTEESDVVKPSANFPIVDLKDDDIAKKTMHYIQVNQVIEKPNTENVEAGRNLKISDFNFLTDLKTNTNTQNLGWLEIAATEDICEKQAERKCSKKLFPVLSKINERFVFLFAGDKIVIREELKQTSSERTALRTPRLDGNASRKQNILVLRMKKNI